MSGPIADLLCGSTPVASSLSGGQVIAEAPPDYGPCPRCGTNRLTRPNTSRCEACTATAPTGSLHGMLRSQPPIERSAATEREFTAALAVSDQATSALGAAGVALEQAWRDARLAVERVAGLEARLTGRAPESCRDERLAPLRLRMRELIQRLESAL
jgi:hypothetical protein